MPFTLRDAIDRTLRRLSLAGGVDTQTYSEEVLAEIINNKVMLLFDKYWWPQYYNPGEVFNLDGATGVVVEDLSTKIKRFQDIRFIWLGTSTSPLGKAPLRTNPMSIQRMCFGPNNDPTKPFKVYPVTTTGTLTVGYRTKPEPLREDEDVILMDDELVILGSAYDYVNGLGLNPGEEGKLSAMFEDRLNSLMTGMDATEIPLGDVTTSPIENRWMEWN